MTRIAIIGTGLIGGSLGLALRQAKGGHEIIGHDLDPEVAGKARKLGAVDKAEWNLPATVADAGLVIVAVPPHVVGEVFGQIAPHLREGAVVTDTASVKGPVLAAAAQHLPQHVSFVGGHPMAGKERGGIENASADLFVGRPYCLVAGEAEAAAIDLVSDLAKAIGAQALFIDPAEHDSLVAGVSHLPFLVAAALVHAPADDSGWKDSSKLASSGFADTTRLASGDPAMYRGICDMNREAILHWLDRYRAQLAALRQLVESEDGKKLEGYFRQAKEARDQWLAPPRAAGRPVPAFSEQMRHMFLGGRREGRR